MQCFINTISEWNSQFQITMRHTFKLIMWDINSVLRKAWKCKHEKRITFQKLFLPIVHLLKNLPERETCLVLFSNWIRGPLNSTTLTEIQFTFRFYTSANSFIRYQQTIENEGKIFFNLHNGHFFNQAFYSCISFTKFKTSSQICRISTISLPEA